MNFDNDASASTYGWSFQVHAGIFLILFYIKDFQSIKVESSLQDIEIVLKDESKILAQAKSSQDPSSTKYPKNRLKDALISLSKNVPTNAKLIYITNITNTFKNYNHEADNTVCSFESCNEKVKNELKKVYESTIKGIESKIKASKLKKESVSKLKTNLDSVKKFDITKLNISLITSYSTNADTRYDAIKQKIIKCLSEDIKINQNKSIMMLDKLFNYWRLKLGDTATLPDNKTFKKNLKREEILWPIIIFLNDTNDYNINDIMSEAIDSSLENECRDMLNGNEAFYHERFAFSNKVLHSYAEYKKIHSSSQNVEKDFIRNKWENFCSEFPEQGFIKNEYLTKMFMLKILHDNRDVERVNNFMGELNED